MSMNFINAKLKENPGKPILGLYIMAKDPTLIEFAKMAGYDFIRIDYEHILFSAAELREIIRTANLVGLMVQIRIPNMGEITKLLDMGVDSIVVTDVDTVEKAKEAIDAVKYWPLGHRGMYPVGRCVWGKKWSEYLENGNKEVSLGIQIENVAAKPILDEIISLEGIDMISSGKQDISESAGIPGKTSDPIVLDMEEAIVKTALKYGKEPVCMATSKKRVDELMALGQKIFTVDMDYELIRKAYKDYADQLRGE